MFFDLAVAGVPAALAYDPADGRMWFTEQSSTAPAVAALQRAGNGGGVSVGETDAFWSAQWSKRIADKAAARVASSFKGWASDVTAASWSARTGNGKPPPAIARSSGPHQDAVEKDGSGLKGDVAGYAVLEVEDPARYAAAPGRDAAGTVRSVYLR